MTHKNLSHLTQKQLEDLIRRYYDNEKVTNLLKEFQINVHSSMLIKLFPDVVHNELFCKYCLNINLASKLESRSHPCYNLTGGFDAFEKFCPVCYHSDNFYCSYSNCKKAIKQQKQTEEEEKRNLIKEKYDYIKTGSENIPIEQLTLKDAVYLLSVVSHSTCENFEFIEPFSNNPSIPDLTPDNQLTIEVIGYLCHKGFIVISPSSPLDAFTFYEKQELQIYSHEKIVWELLPSMNIKEKQQYLDNVRNLVKGEWPLSWKNDIAEMWQEIAKYECIENFKHLFS